MVSVWSKFATPSLVATLQARGELLEGDDLSDHWMNVWMDSAKGTFFSFVNATMFSIGVDAIWLDATEPDHWPQRERYLLASPRGGDPKAALVNVSGSRLMNGFSLGVTSAIHDGLRHS